jgi:hypothetical protein
MEGKGEEICYVFTFLMVFRFYENSGPSREVYVNFGLVTTANEGSTPFPGGTLFF